MIKFIIVNFLILLVTFNIISFMFKRMEIILKSIILYAQKKRIMVYFQQNNFINLPKFILYEFYNKNLIASRTSGDSEVIKCSLSEYTKDLYPNKLLSSLLTKS